MSVKQAMLFGEDNHPSRPEEAETGFLRDFRPETELGERCMNPAMRRPFGELSVKIFRVLGKRPGPPLVRREVEDNCVYFLRAGILSYTIVARLVCRAFVMGNLR